MKKLNWITIGALFLTANVYGQDTYNALTLSQFQPGATARSLGLSGAMGAVGADQGSLEINPAGIGFYRRSEFTFTPEVVISNSSSNLGGSTATDGKVNFELANIGFVVSHELHRSPKWQYFNWGLTLNRTADFNSQISYYNPNTTNSILASYKDELNNEAPYPSNILNDNNLSFGAIGAYNAYLLNPTAADSTQYSSVTDGANIGQQMTIRTSGSIYNLGLTFGSNWNNMLYFGGAIDIPILNFYQNESITENANSGASDGFENFTQNNTLHTSGAGINAKFGVIYRPDNWFRVGASIYTPTYYRLTDNYSSNTVANFDTFSTGSYPLAGTFDYHLTTPFRFVASAAAFFKQYGFLSVDYQYANYADARYNYGGGFTAEQTLVNQMIASTLGAANTIRVGLELAPVSFFRLRGGFSYTTSPIQSSQEIDDANYVLKSYSAGFGFRFNRVFLDFAYIRYVTNTASVFSSPATNSDLVSASNSLKQDNVVMTLGFNFAARRGHQEYTQEGNGY